MKPRSTVPPVAYLASELPALSATFVYEEILGLERRGVSVLPFSVHRPHAPAAGQAELAARVQYLYEGSRLKQMIRGLARLPRQAGVLKALGWLVSDILTCGALAPASRKLAFQFLVAADLAERLRRGGCIHLHVHFAHVPAQIAMYAAALAGVPFTITAHANDIFQRGLLLERKARRARKMLTISEHNLAYLQSVGVPADKLAVVRCGVSFEAGARPPVTGEGPRRIGSLGRLVEKKGFDVLLRALARLGEGSGAPTLEIAGDGPLHGELERLAADLGLTGRVRFLGNLAHDRVKDWMGELDLFVLACKPDAQGDMDGIPVVLMEAMSQSVPVISTRLSGIPELVVDGQTGLLAPPGDPVALAGLMESVLADAALSARLAGQGRAHVMGEFGQGANLDRLMAHLGMAASRQPSPGRLSVSAPGPSEVPAPHGAGPGM